MRRTTRTLWLAVPGLALLASGLVAATEISEPQKTENVSIPSECNQFLSTPKDAPKTMAWQQKLSLAACRQKFEVGHVSDPEQYPALISRIDREMQPSIAIYHDALASGPTPEIRIMAAHGLGMANVTNIIRARNAVQVSAATTTTTPAGTGGAGYGGAAMQENATLNERTAQSQRALEPLLAKYKQGAVTAFNDVYRLAKENQALCENNPVINFMVGNAEAQARLLAGEVEARPTSAKR